MPDDTSEAPRATAGKPDEDRAEAGATRKQAEKDPSEHNAGGQGLSG